MTGKENLIEVLKSKPFVTFAYLFGSRIKGYSNERSDWDIAIYFSKPPQKIKGWPLFEIEAELSRAIGSTVQVIALNSPVSPLLGFEILKEGEILVDRDEGIRIDIVNRILRQYYDWQYFLKRHMDDYVSAKVDKTLI